MPLLKSSHFVLLALAITGSVIYTHQSERAELEARALGRAVGACAEADDVGECEARAERDHEDCFMVNYDFGSAATKYDSREPSLDTRAYLACMRDGFGPWHEARNAKRREEARLRRDALK